MQANEFTMYMHGPFATAVYLHAGQLISIEEDSFRKFLEEKKVRIKDYRRKPISGVRKANAPVFIPMEQFGNALRFILDDFECETPDRSSRCRFEDNAIDFYESGTGIFSTRAKVIFNKQENIPSIVEAEKNARTIIAEKFNREISELNKRFTEFVIMKKLKTVKGLTYNDSKVGTLGWLHTVYHFCNDQYFKQSDIHGELTDDIWRDLSVLIDQVPQDMSPFVDRYVFYGEGKSLIVAKRSVTAEDIQALVRLIETYQYYCFGLYQLDTFLTKEMYAIDVEGTDTVDIGRHHHTEDKYEDKIDEQLGKLRGKIERLNVIRSSTIRYLEQFRYSSNIVFIAGQRPLIEKLEEQWGLDKLERGIRNKLNLFEQELRSEEQTLIETGQELTNFRQWIITNKQDYLNKLILLFTLVSLASVIAQLVILSPLNEAFPERTDDLFKSQLFIVLSVSGVFIVIVLLLYMRSMKKNKQKFSTIVRRLRRKQK